ncbi:MAG: TIGR01212 family radical SAM protein [Cyclobacteriaceae bacterium]|nr:TIGR01212 family radical SAM protein [Cyclobacteriaceae bacterium]
MSILHSEHKIYPWGHERRYNDYPSFVRRTFGFRVQKLSIDAGFTCPNRDGSKSRKGCAYCNNNTFKPGYCEPENTVTQQINEGVNFFSNKYPDMRYLAYFQSYSNTYGDEQLLKRLYQEALDHEKIIGLVLGTRPDCLNESILDLIGNIAKTHFISVEFGIESTLDPTLMRINRQHTYQETIDAIAMTKARGIHTGGHLILGLPGESREELLSHAGRLAHLPIDSLKLHQLQIVKHTTFAKEFHKNPGEFVLFCLEDYIELIVDFVELLRPDITLERFASQTPGDLLIAPRWGLKNFELVARIDKRLAERNTWQGRLYLG